METEAHWTKVKIPDSDTIDLFRQMDGRLDLPANQVSTISVMFVKTGEGVMEMYVHNSAYRQQNLIDRGEII